MDQQRTRREFIRDLGIGTAVLPFILNLPSLGFANQQRRKQRLIVLFSPNGVVPSSFWPDVEGELHTLPKILEPLEPFRERTLILHGVCDKVRGDGDNHMRGIGCLLTGIELFPGNIQLAPIPRRDGPAAFPSIKRSRIVCRAIPPRAPALDHWSLA